MTSQNCYTHSVLVMKLFLLCATKTLFKTLAYSDSKHKCSSVYATLGVSIYRIVHTNLVITVILEDSAH